MCRNIVKLRSICVKDAYEEIKRGFKCVRIVLLEDASNPIFAVCEGFPNVEDVSRFLTELNYPSSVNFNYNVFPDPIDEKSIKKSECDTKQNAK